jgi:hypothetical protein
LTILCIYVFAFQETGVNQVTKIIVEGSWQCSCGTKNRGSVQQCVCGRTRDEDVVFKNDGPQTRAGANGQTEARKGADWLCAHCEQYVDALGTQCPSCGAPPSGVTYHDVQAGRYTHGAMKGSRRTSAPGRHREPPSTTVIQPHTSIGRAPIGAFAAIIGLVVCASLAWWFFFSTTPTLVTLVGVEWKRTVQTERLRTIPYEAWDEEVPLGATITQSYQKQRDTEEIPDGTTSVWEVVDTVDIPNTNCGEKDLGNGFFEVTLCTKDIYDWVEHPKTKEVPINDTYVHYTMKEWHIDQTLTATGTNQSPYSPTLSLGTPTHRLRAGSDTEQYIAYFTTQEAGTFSRTFPFQEWSTLTIGASYPAEVNGVGVILRIKIH